MTFNFQSYVPFMKTQPVYFLSRVADRYGNPFTNPNLYTAYSLGDVALRSRVRSQTYELNLNLTITWNFMTLQAYDQTNRALYNYLVPSYYPVAPFSTESFSYRLDVYSPVEASTQNINLNALHLVLTSDFGLTNYLAANVSNSRNLTLVSGGLQSDRLFGGLQLPFRQNIINSAVL